MNPAGGYSLRPIGFVRSRLTSREEAPLQGAEGAPEAWVEVDPAFADAILGIAKGDEVMLLTWLHLSRRDVLQVHPAVIRQFHSRGCSLPAPRIGRTRSVCTESACWKSARRPGSRSGRSKRSTGHPSWISSQC